MKPHVCVFLYVSVIPVAYCADGVAILKDVAEKTTVATSVGTISDGMSDILSGVAEQNNDATIARARDAYVATFKCRIVGVDGDIQFNTVGVVPSVGDEFLNSKSEYLSLSQKLKVAKKELGMKPGIESQEIIADVSGLYKNVASGKTAVFFEQSDNSNDKIMRGMESVHAGIAASVGANVQKILSEGNGTPGKQSAQNIIGKAENDSLTKQYPISENQSVNNMTKEVNTDDMTEQCPAKYCKGGTEYTDDETCEAWKLCGCQDGPSSADVCATDRGQELCECE